MKNKQQLTEEIRQLRKLRRKLQQQIAILKCDKLELINEIAREIQPVAELKTKHDIMYE